MFKKILALLLISTTALAADIKISQLPLGSAAGTASADSFPYVQAVPGITKRMTIYDIINIPTMVNTYAPKANPTFTGTVTAPTFVGALTGTASGNATVVPNNRGVVLSSTTNALNVLAPNASTAFPLVSGGTGANPTWSLLSVAGGGTGLSAGTSGGILAYTASGTLASSAALTANQLIVGGGAGVVPSTLAAGSQYQVLRMGATTPAYGQINLDQSAAVTGILPATLGGTSFGSYTKGDVLVSSGTSTLVKLGVGSNNQVLTADSTQASGVKWAASSVANAVATKTTTYAILASDGTLITNASGGAFVMTLPDAIANAGKEYTFVTGNATTNFASLATTSSQTINGVLTLNLPRILNATLKLQSNGANWIITQGLQSETKFVTNSGQSIPNATFTILDYATSSRDPFGWVTTGAAWKFTPKISGCYKAVASIQLLSTTWATGNTLALAVFKNGSTDSQGGLTMQGAYGPNSQQVQYIGTVCLDASAGDYADIRAYQDSGTSRNIRSADTLFNQVTFTWSGY